MKWISGFNRDSLLSAQSRLTRIVGLIFSLGLMLLVIIAALASNSSPSLHRSNFIGESYFTHPSYLTNPGSTIHLVNFLITGTYILSTMLVGKWQLTCLSRVFPSLKHFDFLPGAILGFLPGYLTFVAINRMLTLFMPKAIFTITMVIISVIIILLYIDHRIKTWNSAQRKDNRRKSFAVFAVFVLVLLLTFQAGSAHIIGDGALYFLDILSKYSSGGAGFRLPIVSQHYDEALYFLPLLGLISKAQRNYLDWFWLLYAVGKTSALLWIYGSLRSILREGLLPVVLTSIVFLGYLNPNPLALYLFSDAGAGVGIELHIGRAITIAFAFVGTSMLLNSKLEASVVRTEEGNILRTASGFPTLFIAFVLGLGFTSLTASALFTLCLLALMAVIVKSSGKQMIQESIHPILLVLSATVCLAENNKFAGVVFLLLIALGFTRLRIKELAFYALLLKIPKAREILMFSLGIVAGSLFLGNLFSKPIYESLGLSGILYADRGMNASISTFGPNPFLGTFPFYPQGTVYGFLQYYGLPIFVFAFAYSAIRYYKLKLSVAEENVIFLQLLFFSVTLFLYAFMNGAAIEPYQWIFIWVKTRLVDPWFYLLMTIPLVIISKKKFGVDNTNSLRTPIFISSLVYLLVLLIGLLPGGPAGQIFHNANYFLKNI